MPVSVSTCGKGDNAIHQTAIFTLRDMFQLYYCIPKGINTCRRSQNNYTH